MGMTFCTLHLFAVERDALVKKLAPGDLLREQNAPWLSLVPVYDPEHVETQRLEKLAKALTKGTPQAAALLCSYFDDERFLCSFFRDGRKQAGCLSQESWAKLGKKLDELFGDTSATKAFRYAARCFDLEEQVRLLEDSVGTALYDFPEEEQPRRVSRSDRTLREVKAREAALRKRPKQFVLTEMAREEWPERLRLREALLKLLRTAWRTYQLSTLLYNMDYILFDVPGARDLVSYPYIDFEQHRHGVLSTTAGPGSIGSRKRRRGFPVGPSGRRVRATWCCCFYTSSPSGRKGTAGSSAAAGAAFSAWGGTGLSAGALNRRCTESRASSISTAPPMASSRSLPPVSTAALWLARRSFRSTAKPGSCCACGAFRMGMKYIIWRIRRS